MILLSSFSVAKGIYNLSRHPPSCVLPLGWYHSAALIAPLAASRFISAALPLPRKYMYTCCKQNKERKYEKTRKEERELCGVRAFAFLILGQKNGGIGYT